MSGLKKPQSVSLPGPTNQLVDFSPLVSTQTKLLPRSRRLLNASANALKRSNKYQVLQHLAWITPLSRRARTFAIPTLTDTENYRELSGYIQVRKGTYLHAKPEILLTEWAEPKRTVVDEVMGDFYLPGIDSEASTIEGNNTEDSQYELNSGSEPDLANESNMANGPALDPLSTLPEHDPLATDLQSHPLESLGLKPYRYYKLSQSHRLDSKKKHYFDHPVLSAIVIIERVQIAAETTDESAPN